MLTETTLRLAVTSDVWNKRPSPQCATDTGLHVSLAGIKVLPQNADKVRHYFRKFLVGKQVLLKIESPEIVPLPVYLQLRCSPNQARRTCGIRGTTFPGAMDTATP